MTTDESCGTLVLGSVLAKAWQPHVLDPSRKGQHCSLTSCPNLRQLAFRGMRVRMGMHTGLNVAGEVSGGAGLIAHQMSVTRVGSLSQG